MCVCNLRYPDSNAHAPYCHLWPALGLQFFSTSSHKQHNLCVCVCGGGVLNVKCFFLFSLQLLSDTFLNLRRNKQDMIKNTRSSRNDPLFMSDFNET